MKDFIKKIFNYINKIANVRKDALLHCFVSSFLIVLTFNIFLLFNKPAIALAISIVMTSMLGIGKEYIIDKYMRDGLPEKSDLVADFVGICIGTVCCIPLLFI